MNKLMEFLKTRPVAERICLDSLIIPYRTKLSPRQIMALGETGTFSLDLNEKLELQVGGSVIAEGKIVEDDGNFYFEVDEVLERSKGVQEIES